MPRYAEWTEWVRGGKQGRILKQGIRQRRQVLNENKWCYLIEDQEGPIWVPKHCVNIIEENESIQVRNDIPQDSVDSKSV